jgi:hypothetical protein
LKKSFAHLAQNPAESSAPDAFEGSPPVEHDSIQESHGAFARFRKTQREEAFGDAVDEVGVGDVGVGVAQGVDHSVAADDHAHADDAGEARVTIDAFAVAVGEEAEASVYDFFDFFGFEGAA